MITKNPFSLLVSSYYQTPWCFVLAELVTDQVSGYSSNVWPSICVIVSVAIVVDSKTLTSEKTNEIKNRGTECPLIRHRAALNQNYLTKP